MIDKQRLSEFVTWWRSLKGDEKGEAQVFLDHLFKAFGYAGAMEAGGIFEDRIHRHREGKASTAFADFVIPKRVLIEMKKRGEDLRKHYDQAFDYWAHNVPDRPKYVMLCNFDEIWIYDFNLQLYDPMDKLRVEKLAEHSEALSFLFPRPLLPIFRNNRVEVTKMAAASLSAVFKSLIMVRREIERGRPGVPMSDDLRSYYLKPQQAQRLVLQYMLAMFAEDIGLLPDSLFTRLIEDCQEGETTYDLFFLFFTAMNRPGLTPFRRIYRIDYFDGGLFEQIDQVELTPEELKLLREAASHDWSRIRPAIFGTIFEKSMDQKERHQIGGHYTSEADIKRIVDPVIVRPWRERIDAAATVAELRALQDALRHYQVLDPACGSGNFLYIAYLEMKRLEKRILDRIQEMGGDNAAANGQQEIGLVSARQFWGFDINPFAVELAKVTLMIAKKVAVDELGLHEHPLPLDNLDANIRAADALFEPWPEFDACIGNPPYLGAKRLKQEHSAEYVNRVRAAFPDVPGNADYCVYWFRKAHELMKLGARAGLVGTNTIRQNYSRIGGLDYVVAHDGHIFEAVSSIPWSGEAKVHVSIACWSMGEPPFRPARLWVEDAKQLIEAPLISSSLSVKTDVSKAKALPANTEPKRVFQGQTPGHSGFTLTPQEAAKIVKGDLFSQQVIFPYLTGDDLLGQPSGQPSRYIIDFEERPIKEASNFADAFKRLKSLVLPDLEAKAKAEAEKNKEVLKSDPTAKVNRDHESALQQWWLHFRGRPDRRSAMKGMKRYIACSRVTKRAIFEFVDARICPSDALQTFAFDDDYSFGILQSNAHWQWIVEKASTLKSDYRYTPDSVFDTFPWPQNPKPKQVKAVAETARKLREYRWQAINGVKTAENGEEKRRGETGNLRQTYRLLELPGKNPLKDLHAALDKAVLAAYGFDPKGDVLAQLLALNETVAGRIAAGEPVTAPGVPPDYPNPSELVSAGCITPPELL